MKDLLGKIATINAPGLDKPTECRGFEYTPDGKNVRWLRPDGKSFSDGVPIGSVSVLSTPADDADYVPAQKPAAAPADTRKRRVTIADVPASVRKQILAEEKAKQDAAQEEEEKGAGGQGSEGAQDAEGNPAK